jgi:hypothetical protein
MSLGFMQIGVLTSGIKIKVITYYEKMRMGHLSEGLIYHRAATLQCYKYFFLRARFETSNQTKMV